MEAEIHPKSYIVPQVKCPLLLTENKHGLRRAQPIPMDCEENFRKIPLMDNEIIRKSTPFSK